jgi:hypothetical protein
MSIKTTIHLNLATARRQLDHPLIIMAITAAVVVAAGLIAALGNRGVSDHAAAVPTPALPVILIATAAPATPVAQIASAGPNVTPRALVAYDAPDGRALGAIEQGRTYQVLASYGTAWLQANVTGSGVVWFKAADLLGMPAGLVDLQPTATAVVVVHEVPAAPAAALSYQVNAAPTIAPCYHAERQAMVHGISVGVGIGDSCVSQQDANEQAVSSAFAQMNTALQGNH